jgi:hypothetical protein
MENIGKPLANHESNIGKPLATIRQPCEQHWKTIRQPCEKHRKPNGKHMRKNMGNPLENHRKIIKHKGNHWKTMGQPW